MLSATGTRAVGRRTLPEGVPKIDRRSACRSTIPAFGSRECRLLAVQRTGHAPDRYARMGGVDVASPGRTRDFAPQLTLLRDIEVCAGQPRHEARADADPVLGDGIDGERLARAHSRRCYFARR